MLVAAGSPTLGFHALPLLMAAFVACCLLDFVSSLVLMRLVGTVPDGAVQLRVMLTVWAVDACLAPLGLLAAVATEHGLGAVLFVVPLAVLLWLLARDRHRRIEQAHGRLKLVEQERARLQSAVRRLGDAFAAKLELDGLLEILLQGSIEALAAAAGRLDVVGLPSLRPLHAGPADWVRALEGGAAGAHDEAVQSETAGAWTLVLPIRVVAAARTLEGTLQIVRDGRRFEGDEIALLSQLISKAELAATEILSHQALRAQAVTDPLTGLGNRRRLTADLAATL